MSSAPSARPGRGRPLPWAWPRAPARRSSRGGGSGGCFAVRRGAGGALVVRRGETGTRVAAPGVDAIDTTGAGDAFVGAFAAGLARASAPVAAVGGGRAAAGA